MPVHLLVEFVPEAAELPEPRHHGRVRIGVDPIDADLRLSQIGRRGLSEPRFHARETLVGSNENFLLPMQPPLGVLPAVGHSVLFQDFLERPLGEARIEKRGGRGGFALATTIRAAADLTVTVDLYTQGGGHRVDLLLGGELRFLAGALVELPHANDMPARLAAGAGDGALGRGEGSFTVIEAGQTIRFNPRLLPLEGGDWGEAEVRFRFGKPVPV